LRRRLREGDVDAVTVAHSETSTGALNPIEKLSRVVREFEDTILIVDSVTGIGGAELHTDDWKLDFVLTGSQKALALPPGLSFGVASAAMMERSERSTHKGFYFDLTLLQRYLDRLQTPTTPAISLMFALREQLGFIASEGMEARWDRHRQMASRCWEWVEHARRARGLPLEVLAAPGYRSPTVTCIRLPEGRSGPEVASRLRERGFVIGAGYGRLKEGTIRIGHMGEHTLAELETLLEALEEVLTA
jgi:aspartate aminotransferase-like enzyme